MSLWTRKVEFTRNISASEFAHLCNLNLIFGEEISNIYRFNRTKRLKIGHENSAFYVSIA